MCLIRVIGPLRIGRLPLYNGDGNQQNNALDRPCSTGPSAPPRSTIPPNGVQRADCKERLKLDTAKAILALISRKESPGNGKDDQFAILEYERTRIFGTDV